MATMTGADIKKHEEVKQLAEKIFIAWNTFHEPKINPATAWENAEDFCNFAKEKEKQDA